MKRRILVFLGMALMVLASLVSVDQVAWAAPSKKQKQPSTCGSEMILGFRPWFADLCDENSNEIIQPGGKDGMSLMSFVWTIVLNILFDILLAVGYLAIGFTIYAGYLYIIAQGEPARLMKAKRSLSSAVIGTAIAMLGAVIVRTFIGVFHLENGILYNKNQGINNNTIIFDEILPFAYAAAGSVAVAFIIRNGVEYMISRGDPMRTRKATAGLAQAIIGLIIVLIAAGITFFVSSTINRALQ